MPERYPGYDVLNKRRSPSWNAKTREVVEQRLAEAAGPPRFLTPEEFACVAALADRIVPQVSGRAPIPVAALVDQHLVRNRGDGYRPPAMPPLREAWRRGLRALEAEAEAAFGARFEALADDRKDELIRKMAAGDLAGPAWEGMPSQEFFKTRVARDLVHAYYAHPTSWSEIGWGGPASPRGYVRMGYDERDPWDAAEVKEGDVESARRRNARVR